MRKFFFPAFAALFCLYSCNDGVKVAGDTKDNSMAEKNMQASRTVAKAFETGDVSGIDSVVATDFVDHTDRGDKIGRDSLKAMITMMHANFKDMKMKTKKEFADDEYVFQWMEYSGTSDGAMGMPPGPFNMHGIEVVRFKDGMAVEHWGYMDAQEMAKMMGQMQGMDMHKMDSSGVKK